MVSNLDVRAQAVITEVGGAKDGGTIHTEKPLIVGTANPFATVDVYDSATLLGVVVANGQGGWSLQLSTPLFDGVHDLSAVQAADYGGDRTVNYFTVTTEAVETPLIDDVFANHASLYVTDAAADSALSSVPYFPANFFHVRSAARVPDSDASGHTVSSAVNAAEPSEPPKPSEPYARRTLEFAHGEKSVETFAFLGHHQVLDLGALTDRSLATSSGIGGFDLGGQHNALKMSLADTLSLGEHNLFLDDGKQQLMVTGKDGDSVDLSNSPVAGLSDGQWQHHGTAQVGGHTFNVIEHSGSHTELLIEQAVRIELH
ncbi:Ig-like domain-containing protein [Caballeronia sp. LjRoot34]|uniref:hypothetical protein n=1 Tax=Caballeronia sp. LjRoot34 TaxID=3342325 RepID=UPI003ECCF110